MPPAPVLGIDFGTTNTVVAVVVEDGSVEVVSNDIGSRLTPSVVYIDPSDPTKHQIGETALRLGVGEPQNTIRNVKRILGLRPEAARCVKADLGPAVRIGNSPTYGESLSVFISDEIKVTPEEVVAMLLLEMKKAAEHQIFQEVSKAVITVPSYFSAAQRQAIRDAAFLADLDVVQLVNETTAAAAVYAHEREDPKTILVVDVGGGGSSVAVVRVTNDVVTVQACSTRQPGGESFDSLMLQYLKKIVKVQFGKDLTDPRTDEILRAQWVGAKIKLSRLPQASILTFLPEVADEFRRTLTRIEFETECSDLFRQIIESIHETMKKAKVEQDDLKDVILVGGSTRIPKLRELINEALGPNKLHKALSPDEVVAQGAALIGAKSVKIEQEVLGPPTSVIVLHSGKHGNSEKNFLNSSLLPIHLDLHQRTSNKEIVIKQGFDKETITLCHLHNDKYHSIQINNEGCLLFGMAWKKYRELYLNGCIPAASLHGLKQKIQNQEKSSSLEASRVQAKNALEDVLREGRSMTSEDDLFPEEHSKFREKCAEKLCWLDNHVCADKETFDGICKEMEKAKESLQEKCKKERERQRVRSVLKDILDKAVDMEVFEDEFKERTTKLVDDWKEAKAWLAENQEASLEDFHNNYQSVLQAMEKLKEDRLKAEAEKRTEEIRECLQNKIKKILTTANEKNCGDALDREFGKDLEKICQSTTMWLHRNPGISEEELRQKMEMLDKHTISTTEKFEQSKRARETERKTAFKTAECTILIGVNLKVADFESVHYSALNFVEECNKQLQWLRKNPDRDATEFKEITRKVQLGLQDLQTLHNAENNRLQVKDRFQHLVQSALKQTEEQFCFVFEQCLKWLQDNPSAEEELMKISMSLVEDAVSKLKESRKHAENAKKVKELALKKTEDLAKLLELQHIVSTTPKEIRIEDSDYKPAEFEESVAAFPMDRNGLMTHANGLPSLTVLCSPTRSDNDEHLAVTALMGAGEAELMALLLSKVMLCGREFVSLAVRYVDESGQPVERSLFVKELIGPVEDVEIVKELFLEPFLTLCKKAPNLQWKKNLLGISHAGFGDPSEVLVSFLRGMRCDRKVQDLDSGAVRLDERFVRKILHLAGSTRIESDLNSLRDFFLTIDSLRTLFCVRGKWCKVLVDNCRTLPADENPWHTYTGAITFVSVEKKKLLIALSTIATKDRGLMILVEAIKGKMQHNTFGICLQTCNELFKVVSGFEDKLAHEHSNSIMDLKNAILKTFKYPKESVKPSFVGLTLQSDKLQAKTLFQLSLDYMDSVLEEWMKSWDPLLSLLTAICDVLLEGDGKETPARKTRSQHRLLAQDLRKFKDQFPHSLISLPAMLGELRRARFSREFPLLRDALMNALTAPYLPPSGPRAQEQLRDRALRAVLGDC